MSKELIDLLDNRMKQHAAGALVGTLCVLGTITANGVKLDDFKHEITDPLYAWWTFKLSIPAHIINAVHDPPNSTTVHAIQAHDIDRVAVDFKVDMQPGDRVLVIPINNGQDCVILCKVVT